jgi:tRNA G18 (ribose-2'-O)-methylase SpoU
MFFGANSFFYLGRLPTYYYRSRYNKILLGFPGSRQVVSRLLSAIGDREGDATDLRQFILQNQLKSVGVDAQLLHKSAIQSILHPSQGYDNRFGKSAIRAYRAFLKSTDTMENDVQVQAAAARCARQVDFLIKRHKSREAEWVRHTDTRETRTVYPLILVLDNVRSAFNVGSLFRTADAAGCSMVITTGITPHPGGSGEDKLAKSALGAERLVPHLHFGTMKNVLEYLRSEKKGYTIIGMETTDKSKLYTSIYYPKEGCALILGNEVTGVDTEIMPLLDDVIEIPMFGAKNSLNIAACAPVVLYEALRQWGAMDRYITTVESL